MNFKTNQNTPGGKDIRKLCTKLGEPSTYGSWLNLVPQVPLIAGASENFTSPDQISKVENSIKNRNFETNRNTPGGKATRKLCTKFGESNTNGSWLNLVPQVPLIAGASENFTSPNQISKVENSIKNRNFDTNQNTPGGKAIRNLCTKFGEPSANGSREIENLR